MPRTSTRLRRRAIASLSAVAAAAASLSLASPAVAASTTVVVNEVFGGGGNQGATLTNDFVELRNLSASPVSVAGWSVQYASAAGTSWQVTPLTGSIPAGGTYLVQEAAGANGTVPLPTPDATGSIAMSGTSGKIALVSAAGALACAAACTTAAGVVDFLGYGAANNVEGTGGAPALSNTTSAARNAAGVDTDNNVADFTVGVPTPTNAAGQTSGGGGPIDPPPVGTPAEIAQIQGAAHRSPLVGQVVQTTGIVTAVGSRQYWIQDPTPDADPATSDGLQVFGNAAADVAVGDSVSVVGTVSEFRGRGATDLSVTELTTPFTTKVTSGNPVPAATLVGPGGLVPPGKVFYAGTSSNIETNGTFAPATNGIDFWESLEGTLITLDSPDVVGPTNGFGELPVVPKGSTTRTPRGGIIVGPDDFNPERILVTDDIIKPIPTANTGDSLVGAVTGVVDYSFSNFNLILTAPATVVNKNLPREVTTPAGKKQLAVATFNVENLDPTDDPAKFAALAEIIVTNLAAPDVVALEEVQDNNGATNDGTVAANLTLDQLVAAIQAAGGPTYQWSQIDPEDKTDGGEPGGNIRVAFLYRTDRGLTFVNKPGGTATTAVGVTGYGKNTHLTTSPGRVNPTNPAWSNSRKPLVGEFGWQGKTVFVVANHFNSKGGDQPLFGNVQPPVQSSQVQRLQQAKVLAAFVDSVYKRNPLANIVVTGDLNDYEFSGPVEALAGKFRLLDLIKTLPQNQRYTYVFQGNSQTLDHILISPALLLYFGFEKGKLIPPFAYDVVHVNSEYADQVSDHDPQVVKIFN